MLEPNRNYVIEDDGSIHKMLFCGDADWEERPTTSIQEIRAKVIDEFAELVKRKIYNNREEFGSDEVYQYEIDEIAEQLKAGGIIGQNVRNL